MRVGDTRPSAAPRERGLAPTSPPPHSRNPNSNPNPHAQRGEGAGPPGACSTHCVPAGPPRPPPLPSTAVSPCADRTRKSRSGAAQRGGVGKAPRACGRHLQEEKRKETKSRSVDGDRNWLLRTCGTQVCRRALARGLTIYDAQLTRHFLSQCVRRSE